MITKICQECGKSFLGSTNPQASKICRSCVQKHANKKRKKTMIEKYGVDNIMKLPNAGELVKAGFERKYGSNIHSAMDIPEARKKFKNTMTKKYGVSYYVQTKEWNDHSHFKISAKNKEICAWLCSKGYESELEFPLDTKSYDIHIKHSNILLEINPSYTHSVVPNHWSPKGLSENYHLEKSKIAESYGYRCIHIFDWDNWKTDLIAIIENIQILPSNYDIPDEIIIDRSKYFYKDMINKGYKPVKFTKPILHFSKNNQSISLNEWSKLVDVEKMQYLPIYDCGYIIMKKSAQDIDIIDESNADITFPNYQEYEEFVKSKNQKIRYKKCKFCDKPFIPNSSRQLYCKGPHIRQCPVCGKDYIEDNTDNLKRPPVACSYECRQKRMQETSIKRYGCKAPGNNLEARKKAKSTMIKNYGVEFTLQSKELRQKVEKSIISKYGVDNVQKNANIKQKSTQTLRHNTWNRKYGDITPQDISCEDMEVFILKESYAEKFIREYHKELFIPAKLYAGLVKDNIVYRCISFNPCENYRLIIIQDCSLPQYNIIDGDLKIFKSLSDNYDVSKIRKYV